MAKSLRSRKESTQPKESNTHVPTTKKSHKSKKTQGVPAFAKGVAVGLLAYYGFMMYVRSQHRGLWALADTLWVCNMNILIAALGIANGYTALVGATVTAVFVPHLVWTIDMVAWLLTGNFPIGMAAYMAWPETSWGERLSSTHHFWFIPICILVIHQLRGKFTIKSLFISLSFILPVLYASQFFPEEIILKNGETFYLNINMAHGWWKDVSGWPFSLVPTEHTPYLVFLHIFTTVKFAVSFVAVKLITHFVL